ncbi:MAG: cytochrome c family protein [Nitrospira sp.]|nr:cytochrome c family protein [Nitrospira sp.]MCP9473657.1 cytochrome c family protein [Nitrospira sp.]
MRITRKVSQEKTVRNVTKSTKWIWRSLIGFAVFGGLTYLYYTEVKPVVIFGLRSDYAHAIPYQEVPQGLTGLKAESCGVCHPDIYNEWKTSIHAQAYDDPFFQAYWTKDKRIWVCLNCHTPLENQQPTLIKAIPRERVERAVQEPNPRYDPDYQREGVTCAACHVRDGVILGPYEDAKAPHPTKYDPMFRTTQLCQRCHSVVGGPAQFYNGGPCGTYTEFEDGYWSKERGYICQTCHMPKIERPVAVGGPVRTGRRHLWRGGHDPEMLKRAIDVKLAAEPAEPKPGDRVRVTLTLTNAGAGHKLPTGDPDRHFTVEFAVRDRDGRVLKDQSDTMGRWILWQPAIVELYDNRLMPLASRAYTFDYRWPREGENQTLSITVRYHILTERQHQMLIDKYGLTAPAPYHFTLYAQEVPLTGNLRVSLAALARATHPACSGPKQG